MRFNQGRTAFNGPRNRAISSRMRNRFLLGLKAKHLWITNNQI